jgi:hypothetical protein
LVNSSNEGIDDGTPDQYAGSKESKSLYLVPLEGVPPREPHRISPPAPAAAVWLLSLGVHDLSPQELLS